MGYFNYAVRTTQGIMKPSKGSTRSGPDHTLYTTYIQFLIVAVTLTLSHARVCQNNPYNCSSQIGAPCTVFRTNACDPMSGCSDVPSAPGNLNVETHQENGTTVLNVSWSFPNDASVDTLVGFMVTALAMNGPNINQRECFNVSIPDICNVNTSATIPAKMFLDCFNSIVDGVKYFIMVTSLPTPGPPHRPHFVETYIDIPKSNETHNACTWSPTISWQQDNNNLHTTVHAAPPGVLRKLYKFNLFECKTDPCDARRVTKVLDTIKKEVRQSDVEVTFQQLKPATYYLQLIVDCGYSEECEKNCSGFELPRKYIGDIKISAIAEQGARKKKKVPTATLR